MAVETRRPDGLISRHTRVKGTFAYGVTPDAFSFTPDASGPDSFDTRWEEPAAPTPWPQANRSTRSISYTDLTGRCSIGNTLATREELFDGSVWTPIGWEVTRFDTDGRPTNTLNHAGAITESRWGCCGKEWERAADGAVTEWLYDPLQRVQLLIRQQGAYTNFTEYTYDAAGRQLSQTTSAGTLSQTTTSTYDTAGHLLTSTDAQNITTTYEKGCCGLESTTIRASLTNTTVRYPDGRTHYTEQNGIRQTTHTHGVNPDGTQWTRTVHGSPFTVHSPWTQSTTDLLGRTLRTDRPGFSGAGLPPAVLITSNLYNTAGQLIRTESSSAGGVHAATLYIYDPLGNATLTAKDLNLNGTIDLAGPDRVTSNATDFIQISGDWYHESSSYAFPEDNNATPILTGTQRQRLTGLGTATDHGLLTAETISIDLLGNQTLQQTHIDRDTRTIGVERCWFYQQM